MNPPKTDKLQMEMEMDLEVYFGKDSAKYFLVCTSRQPQVLFRPQKA
jgi:hypothetical protein